MDVLYSNTHLYHGIEWAMFVTRKWIRVILHFYCEVQLQFSLKLMKLQFPRRFTLHLLII